MTLLSPDKSFTQQNPRQSTNRLLMPVTYLLWALSEVASWIVRPPKLTPSETTKRSYETLLDPLCADTGIWLDYTEGYHETGSETYAEAQKKQFDYILAQCGCQPGTKVFDMGCGNGGLLQYAAEQGCIGAGVTLSSVQAETCRAAGHDVVQGNIFDIQERFESGQFDVVVINGSSEHYVSAEDAVEGKAAEIRTRFFEIVQYLLRPGGKFFITCIHYRYPTQPNQLLKHPLRHDFGSYDFYCSILYHFYAGWYPHEGDYEAAASKVGFKKLLEREATEDYLKTSIEWCDRYEAFKRDNKAFMVKHLWPYFFRDPRYLFIGYLYDYYYAWSWQFRGGADSPMKHKWLLFESTKANQG
ncbi:MAG: class I SAM-dependent methyltransferase [Chloroflexota bacterium]